MFPPPETDRLILRDLQEGNAELYLQDAKVYDNASGEFLYDVAGMYVSLERTDMTIELTDATLEKESTVESE